MNAREHSNSHVKVLEGYPVVGIRPLKRGFKYEKVVPRYEPALVLVCDAKQNRPLPSRNLQFTIRRYGVHELLWVEESTSATRAWTRNFIQQRRARGTSALTHFWPFTSVFAFASNVRLHLVNSVSFRDTALLTVSLMVDAVVPTASGASQNAVGKTRGIGRFGNILGVGVVVVVESRV